MALSHPSKQGCALLVLLLSSMVSASVVSAQTGAVDSDHKLFPIHSSTQPGHQSLINRLRPFRGPSSFPDTAVPIATIANADANATPAASPSASFKAATPVLDEITIMSVAQQFMQYAYSSETFTSKDTLITTYAKTIERSASGRPLAEITRFEDYDGGGTLVVTELKSTYTYNASGYITEITYGIISGDVYEVYYSESFTYGESDRLETYVTIEADETGGAADTTLVKFVHDNGVITAEISNDDDSLVYHFTEGDTLRIEELYYYTYDGKKYLERSLESYPTLKSLKDLFSTFTVMDQPFSYSDYDEIGGRYVETFRLRTEMIDDKLVHVEESLDYESLDVPGKWIVDSRYETSFNEKNEPTETVNYYRIDDDDTLDYTFRYLYNPDPSVMEIGYLEYFATSVDPEEGRGLMPTAVSLAQNVPNPFNPSTQIRFDLPEAGLARLAVYDLTGREVAVLVDRRLAAGVHTVDFAAGGLASGVYLYRLMVGGGADGAAGYGNSLGQSVTVQTRMMTLIK